MIANRTFPVALAILLTLSALIPVHANQNTYLSLYYADPSTTKTITDRILLVDGRSLSIERGKIHAPKRLVRTDWNKFYEESAQPPKSDVRLEFKTINRNTNVCMNSSCAIVRIACPPAHDVTRGAKCLPVPSLGDLDIVFPIRARQDVYLSLYYANPAPTKKNGDMLLFVDGRTVSLEGGKIRPPKTFIRTKWNEFQAAFVQPPISDLGLHFRSAEGKTNVCLNNSCAIVGILCPPERYVTKGARCLPAPSLLDLDKVK